MGLPKKPVELSVAQIEELHRNLSNLRHDVNNHLSLIMAASELISHKPEMTERMTAMLTEQPSKIIEVINKFSVAFEQTFGITRS